MLRLGMGARLREVDPTGRFGLVTTWRLARRIVDLVGGQRHQRVPVVNGTGAEILSARADDVFPWPCPLPSGGLIASVNLPGFEGIYIWKDSPGGGERGVRPLVLRRARSTATAKRLCLAEDGSLAVVARDDEQVEVIDVGAGSLLRRVSEPGQVVHAVALSQASDLLALGSYGQVVLFRLSDGERLDVVQVSDGNLRWIGLGRGVIATITEHGVFEAHRAEHQAPAPDGWRLFRRTPGFARGVRSPYEASLSDDGQLVALRAQRNNAVVVLDLVSSVERELTWHSDRVNLVRFVRGGRGLVTADYDNRVVIWPRRYGQIVTERNARAHD